MHFDPEIIVNAGSSGRILTDSFSVLYSVTNDEAFSQLINKTSTDIHTEEPFDTSLVSAYLMANTVRPICMQSHVHCGYRIVYFNVTIIDR